MNEALTNATKSGKATELYKKWFTSHTSPKGINLNFPMVAEVRDDFTNPTVKPYRYAPGRARVAGGKMPKIV